MTDNEMAEEYADKECCQTCTNTSHTCKEKCECWSFARKGFLAGRPKWHKAADGNLPKVNSTVLDENGDKVVYIGGGEWEAYSEYYEKYVGVSQPFAWCEVPRYTEEINK